MKTALPASPTDSLARFKPPPGTGTIGLIWFLVGLSLAFGWVLYGYLAVRRGYDIEHIALPVWFWFSTFFILVSSVTLQTSLMLARMNNTKHARRALIVSTVLGYLFLAIQTPGLIELTSAYAAVARLYYLILLVVLLHAAHVLGGLAAMTVLAVRSLRTPCNAERAPVLKNMCIYWHYLTIVWMIIFATFLFGEGVTPIIDMQ